MPAPGNNPPQRKDWREASQPRRAAAAAGAAAPRTAGWTKKTTDNRYESALLRHRLRVGFWSLLFLGLVGALVYYLFWRPVRTPLVAYVATAYAAPLPPNAWASEDLAGLRSLGAGGNLLEEKRLVDFHEAPPWESKEQWLRELRRQIETAAPGGPTKRAIIIYLSLHGAVDGQGEPCLIPPGGSPWQSGQWVRIRDLLNELFATRDEKGVWSSKTRGLDKLLVLDCNRIDADWRLGQFYNAFAQRLRDVVQKAGVPKLYVLNSTSPGQTAWSAPELQGSVFGHFFAQGLSGAADLDSEGGNNNHQVSLRELHNYLRAHINQWVTENRDDRQEPMLLPDDAPDVPLVFCGAAQSQDKTTEPAPRDPGWDCLAGLWEEHAQLRAKMPYRVKPLEWEVYQYDLLRAEQLLQAGGAYRREFDNTLDRITSEAAALDRPAEAPEAAPYSLAVAEQWRPAKEHEIRDLPAPWLPGAKPTSADPSQAKPAATAAKPDAKAPPAATAPPRYTYLPAAAAAWKRALNRHDSPDDLKQVLDFVDAAEGQPGEGSRDGSLKADVVEVQFLRMLAAYLDAKVWDRPDILGRALAARQLAEEAVASPDLVAQYWIRTIVDAADADRRLAEDKLYVGSPDALKQAESLWDNVAAIEARSASEAGGGEKYREAIRRASAVSKALTLRDRSLAEGPYLAQCLLGRLTVGKPDAADLRKLLEGTRRLTTLLETTPEADQWPAELPQAAAAVEDSLKKLAAADADEYYTLRTAADDAHTLRRIVGLLSLPLVSGAERNALREKALGIMSAQQSSAAGIAGKAPHETTDLGGQWLARLEQWENSAEHPALALLNLGATEPGEAIEARSVSEEHSGDLSARLAAEGEKARNRLAELTGRVQQGAHETLELLAKHQPDRPAAVRQGCCRAERALRASAALFAGGPAQDLQVDPIAELRRYDLHEFLLWQARRTMDDFWGPKPDLRGAAVPAALADGAVVPAALPAGETPALRQSVPYFEIVARDELRSADKLQHAADLPEAARLEQLTAAAENVVRPGVTPDKLLVDSSTAEVPQTMTVDIAPGLPRGEAAIFLAYSRGPLPALLRENHLPWRRLPLDVQDAGQVKLPEYLIASDRKSADWQSGSDWRAEAFYRGHVRTAAFNFAPLRGVEIAYTPQKVEPAKITVFGQSKQRLGIMFIFDCSGSMGDLVEAKDPAAPKEKKINVARDAFHEVLESLAADEGACRAGLIAYGHRVWENDGWFKQFPKGELLTWDRANEKIDSVKKLVPPNPALENLNPDTDVEVMDFPGGTIAPLTRQRAKDMKARLDQLHDLGMTPLYLAIMKAIDELNADPGSTEKQIVVMTDGVNEQNDARLRNTCAELVAKLKENPNVRLDIVAFDIADDRNKPEFKMMTDQLVGYLRTNRRGDYIEAEKFDDLLNTLRKWLALNKYEVCRKESDTRVAGPLELNRPCDIRPLTPGWFQARVVDAQLPAAADFYLAGGEALRLFLRPGRDALVHERFDHDEDLAVRDYCEHIADPLDLDHTHWIAAHLPKWQGDGVQFFVSVQNGDAERFSPRPCEVWAEIAPLPPPADANEPKKYVYYDTTFVPDKPVPVLEYLAPRWPRQAQEAQIELWCKFHPTREDEVPLGRLKSYRVADVPDVRLDWSIVRGQSQGRTKIVVDEWHPKGADIYRLKVELQTGGSAPVKEVRRLYDSAAGDLGLVRHEFILDGDPPPSDIENFTVRLVSRQRLQKDAVKLPRSLRVTIAR